MKLTTKKFIGGLIIGVLVGSVITNAIMAVSLIKLNDKDCMPYRNDAQKYGLYGETNNLK